MKHVYVIPTDSPSNLYKRNDLNTFHLGDFDVCEKEDSLRINQHIYIVSDEEVNNGDWCLPFLNGIEIQNKIYKVINNETHFEDKKIILTNNTDLIKDGVKSIDNDFILWVIENKDTLETISQLNEEESNDSEIISLDKLLSYYVDISVGEMKISLHQIIINAYNNGLKFNAEKIYSKEQMREAIAEAWNSSEDNEDDETFSQVLARIMTTLNK